MKSDFDVILKDAPAAVRRAMRDDAGKLAPGAAHVMGRFWSAVRAQGQPVHAMCRCIPGRGILGGDVSVPAPRAGKIRTASVHGAREGR